MSKSYINKRGYVLVKEYYSKNIINKLREELTVKPFVAPGYGTEQESYPIFEENEKKIYIPKIFGINKFGETENRIPDGEDIDLKFNGNMRENQIEPLKASLKALHSIGGGMLVLPCGFGKTALGLKLVSEIKKKTIVICHKEFLVSQWRERIEVFLPDARVGKIQGTTFDIEDKDIVIGMLQTISMREFPLDAFNSFNFLLIDECFPGGTTIITEDGVLSIYTLYNLWKKNQKIPKILSFNLNKKIFEYKKLTHGWRKEKSELIKIKCSKRIIRCTPNHKILTTKGYIPAEKLTTKSLIISKYDNRQIDSQIAKCLNDDQLDILIGSYLGDGNINKTSHNRYRLRIIHGKKQHKL